MSDFLTRASEAALGVSRAVKPLVTSRYAPGPREPLLEMETIVDQSTSVGASAANSGERQDRPPGTALNEPGNAHEQTSENETRAGDRVGASETSVRETVNRLPLSARQDEPSPGVQPLEHTAESITEHKENSLSTVLDDRRPVDARDSLPPAATVPESAGEPEDNLTTSLVAPLSARSISIEATETQSAATDATILESERTSNGSFSPADQTNLDDSGTGRRDAVVTSKLEVAVSAGDYAKRPGDRFNETVIVKTRPNEVSRTDSEGHLDQPSFSLRDESSAPDNSMRRSVTARAISETSISEASISVRGEQDYPGPPTIRVTIGRIDVRAVTPPSPPVQPTAPTQPKLSLEEYLRQHNGRRS